MEGILRSLIFLTTLTLMVGSTIGLVQNGTSLQKPITKVDYRPGGKLIYVLASVNGSEPLWFILDSGAPDSLIDSKTARRLNIQAASAGTIHGAGK